MSIRSDIPCNTNHRLSRLRSESGASIILALIVFLVCALVAAIIISGASINAERSNQEIKEEQAYLDLRSSANLIVKLFYPASAKPQMVTVDFTDEQNPTYKGPSTLDETGNGSDIAGWIKASAKEVKGGTAAASETFTIKGSNPYANATTASQPVDATFSMDEFYNIIVELKLQDQSNNGTALRVTIPATNNLSATPPTVTWNDSTGPTIERVGVEHA